MERYSPFYLDVSDETYLDSSDTELQDSEQPSRFEDNNLINQSVDSWDTSDGTPAAASHCVDSEITRTISDIFLSLDEDLQSEAESGAEEDPSSSTTQLENFENGGSSQDLANVPTDMAQENMDTVSISDVKLEYNNQPEEETGPANPSTPATESELDSEGSSTGTCFYGSPVFLMVLPYIPEEDTTSAVVPRNNLSKKNTSRNNKVHPAPWEESSQSSGLSLYDRTPVELFNIVKLEDNNRPEQETGPANPSTPAVESELDSEGSSTGTCFYGSPVFLMVLPYIPEEDTTSVVAPRNNLSKKKTSRNNKVHPAPWEESSQSSGLSLHDRTPVELFNIVKTATPAQVGANNSVRDATPKAKGSKGLLDFFRKIFTKKVSPVDGPVTLPI